MWDTDKDSRSSLELAMPALRVFIVSLTPSITVALMKQRY